jgi:hypothetical protein
MAFPVKNNYTNQLHTYAVVRDINRARIFIYLNQIHARCVYFILGRPIHIHPPKLASRSDGEHSSKSKSRHSQFHSKQKALPQLKFIANNRRGLNFAFAGTGKQVMGVVCFPAWRYPSP